MLFLDANAFYSYIGRKNIGLIESTHVNEEGRIFYSMESHSAKKDVKYSLKETMGIYKGILSVRGNLIVSVFLDTARK